MTSATNVFFPLRITECFFFVLVVVEAFKDLPAGWKFDKSLFCSFRYLALIAAASGFTSAQVDMAQRAQSEYEPRQSLLAGARLFI